MSICSLSRRHRAGAQIDARTRGRDTMFTNSVRSALRRASTAAISSSTSASVASFERAVVARVARSSPRNYYQIAADRSASASASARASQGVAANAFHASRARARGGRPPGDPRGREGPLPGPERGARARAEDVRAVGGGRQGPAGAVRARGDGRGLRDHAHAGVRRRRGHLGDLQRDGCASTRRPAARSRRDRVDRARASTLKPPPRIDALRSFFCHHFRSRAGSVLHLPRPVRRSL